MGLVPLDGGCVVQALGVEIRKDAVQRIKAGVAHGDGAVRRGQHRRLRKPSIQPFLVQRALRLGSAAEQPQPLQHGGQPAVLLGLGGQPCLGILLGAHALFIPLAGDLIDIADLAAGGSLVQVL